MYHRPQVAPDRPIRHEIIREKDKIRYQYGEVQKTNFAREFGLIIVGALIFLASFLWKDFLNDVQEVYFPRHHGLWGRGIYILIITLILVTVAVHIKNAVAPGNEIVFDSQPEPTNGNGNDAHG